MRWTNGRKEKKERKEGRKGRPNCCHSMECMKGILLKKTLFTMQNRAPPVAYRPLLVGSQSRKAVTHRMISKGLPENVQSVKPYISASFPTGAGLHHDIKL